MDWISSEDAFAAWAPPGVLWSQWAKPIAFVRTARSSLLPVIRRSGLHS
jgi:hypothetical protein